MQATIRFRQQSVDDRVEVFDACARHADLVRAGLVRRRAERPETLLDPLESTPPADAECPYDGPGCAGVSCGDHDGLVRSAIEDGHLMGT